MAEEWTKPNEELRDLGVDLVPAPPAPLVRAAHPQAVCDAVDEYRKIQEALDAAMPDCIQQIAGKAFRKKNYWRAIATAFNLTVEMVEEREDPTAGLWVVTYKATATNGRYATGDGACSASEKSGDSATVHNVRSHAHTRAYNRAVSNLVGFGEVSAEEVEREPAGTQARPGPSAPGDTRGAGSGSAPHGTSPAPSAAPISRGPRTTPNRPITPKQKSYLMALAGKIDQQSPLSVLTEATQELFQIEPQQLRMEHMDPLIAALRAAAER